MVRYIYNTNIYVISALCLRYMFTYTYRHTAYRYTMHMRNTHMICISYTCGVPAKHMRYACDMHATSNDTWLTRISGAGGGVQWNSSGRRMNLSQATWLGSKAYGPEQRKCPEQFIELYWMRRGAVVSGAHACLCIVRLAFTAHAMPRLCPQAST